MKNYLIILLLFPLLLTAQETEIDKAEEMPRFPGCEEIEDLEKRKQCSQTKMLTYIYKNIKYPGIAAENGTEGTVIIHFTITKDGSIKDAEIKQNIGDGCGEEALRVIQSMSKLSQKWIPGKQDGQLVNVEYTLPINFKLSADTPPSPPEDLTVYKVAEQMPRFPGCEDIADMKERKICAQKKMIEFLYKRLRYPAEARKNSTEGTVAVRFLVMQDGNIKYPEIIQSLSWDCDAEVLRLVQLMTEMPEKWIPGKQAGENVNVYFNLPVKFKLESSKKLRRKKRN